MQIESQRVHNDQANPIAITPGAQRLPEKIHACRNQQNQQAVHASFLRQPNVHGVDGQQDGGEQARLSIEPHRSQPVNQGDGQQTGDNCLKSRSKLGDAPQRQRYFIQDVE